MDDTSRVVLITGATRGIGAAIADAFGGENVELLLTGTREDEIDRLNETSLPERRYLQADFSSSASLEAFLEQVEALDRLDVCINNAGINIIKSVDDVAPADFDRLTAVNYRAPYLISQAAARIMKRQGRGWIVNIGSIWSVITKPGRSLYCASKAGLAGMTRAIATDLAPHGVLVNCVSPGFVMTDMTRQSLSEEEVQQLASQVPLGRFAAPTEIARVVSFLGSPSNTYLTGQNIVVDGGFCHV